MAEKTSGVLLHLMKSEEYSDFKITCQGKSFSLHQAVVCTQSPVIARALRGEFKEGTSKIIEITAFDKGTVERMIDFLYTEDYKVNAEDIIADLRPDIPQEQNLSEKQDETTEEQPVQPGQPQQLKDEDSVMKDTIMQDSIMKEPLSPFDKELHTLRCHVRVNEVAHYYDIPKLARHSRGKIADALRKNWRPKLYPAITKEIMDSSGDELLHTQMQEIAAGRIEDLIGLQEFAEMGAFTDYGLGILRGCVQRLQKLQAQTKSQLQSQQRSRQRLVEDINNCRAKLKNTKNCRWCDARFACYIQRNSEESQTIYELKCSKCHNPAV